LHPICDRVSIPGLGECLQSQPVSVAGPAGFGFELLTRPGAVERRAQFDSSLNDLTFSQMNHGRDDPHLRFQPRLNAHQPRKNTAILRPMLSGEVTREIVVAPRADHKFDFNFLVERIDLKISVMTMAGNTPACFSGLLPVSVPVGAES
jgi:hypothetical protein